MIGRIADGMMILLILALGSTGCGSKTESHPVTEPGRGDGLFHSVYEPDRIIIDSVRRDLDEDGLADLLVFSRGPEARGVFDRVEVFSLDTAWNRWRSRFVDPLDHAVGYRFADLTGDGRMDLLVELDSKLADPIVARGLQVYGLDRSGSFTLLFASSTGSPRVLEGQPATILTQGRYLGLLPMQQSPIFVTSISVFRGTQFHADTAALRGFRTEAKAAENQWAAMQRMPAPRDSASILAEYRSFAVLAMWTYILDGESACATLWLKERPQLASRLPGAYLRDLEDFCAEPSFYHEAISPPSRNP